MRVGSLFSGIGGIDLGFSLAGHKIVWANDFDSFACKTYSHNFPNTTIFLQDVRLTNPDALPDIDILAAGFPCQPFSVMGYKKGFNDPRGNLFFEIARIADEKQPQIIFLENVKNLMNHDNGKTFMIIHKTLSELGYYIKYKVMSPHEYADIPQIRERIYIIAFRDLNLCDRFTFPEPKLLTKSINDMIDRSVQHNEIYYYLEKSKYYNQLNERIKDKVCFYRIDDWGVAKRKWEICPTLKANMGTYTDRVPIMRDDFGIRKLTPHECLKFQGFPESFTFPNIPLKEAYKQCGNTVSMPVAKEIAKHIYKLFE